jgi:2-aminoethylphosphonate-pyruvate transaminase
MPQRLSINTTFKGPEGQEDMPYLLTPGPLTTSLGVKLATLADWGSRDTEFIATVRSIRSRLLALAGADETYDCVLMQGSGTFAIEAALGSFAPVKNVKTLVVANGAYGDRAANILQRINRPFIKVDKGDSAAPSAAEIEPLLQADKAITHIWLVHCETTSGIVNPVTDIASMAKSLGRITMVDAMSSFGALPINVVNDGIDVLVSSSNKCIEGIPGFSYVIVKKDMLNGSVGRSHSIVLDLFEQWRGLESNGQFRFTPPTHALVAFNQALQELETEGGPDARLARYQRNADILIGGLERLGFKTLLGDNQAGPIIQTFLTPGDSAFHFETFYEALRKRGFAIYPGKLTKQPSFRIGTIGQINADVMTRVVQAIGDVIKEMGVRDCGPAASGEVNR